MTTQNQSDLSESSPQNPSQKLNEPSENSINPLWKQEKEKLLLSYRAKAEAMFASLRRDFPDQTTLDVANVMLILLIPITEGEIRKALKLILNDILDQELINNGILPFGKEQKDSSAIPSLVGKVRQERDIQDNESQVPPINLEVGVQHNPPGFKE